MQSVQAIEPKDRAERLAVLRKLINYEVKHAPDYYRAWLDTQVGGPVQSAECIRVRAREVPTGMQSNGSGG